MGLRLRDGTITVVAKSRVVNRLELIGVDDAPNDPERYRSSHRFRPVATVSLAAGDIGKDVVWEYIHTGPTGNFHLWYLASPGNLIGSDFWAGWNDKPHDDVRCWRPTKVLENCFDFGVKILPNLQRLKQIRVSHDAHPRPLNLYQAILSSVGSTRGSIGGIPISIINLDREESVDHKNDEPSTLHDELGVSQASLKSYFVVTKTSFYFVFAVVLATLGFIHIQAIPSHFKGIAFIAFLSLGMFLLTVGILLAYLAVIGLGSGRYRGAPISYRIQGYAGEHIKAAISWKGRLWRNVVPIGAKASPKIITLTQGGIQ